MLLERKVAGKSAQFAFFAIFESFLGGSAFFVIFGAVDPLESLLDKVLPTGPRPTGLRLGGEVSVAK